MDPTRFNASQQAELSAIAKKAAASEKRMNDFMADLPKRLKEMEEAGRKYEKMDMQQLLEEQKAIFASARVADQPPAAPDDADKKPAARPRG